MAASGSEHAAGDRVRRAVAELYAAEPGDFVPRRTELVKEARADKDREAATDIGALRKPSTSAWAINQVVRKDGELIGRLRELGARMRHAQSTLDGGALASLRTERDTALRDLATATAAAAQARRQAALSEAVLAEIRDTAVAALADARAEEIAWSGSLTRALQYSGFGEVDVSDAVARTSTGVLLARIEGGAGAEHDEVDQGDEVDELDETDETDETDEAPEASPEEVDGEEGPEEETEEEAPTDEDEADDARDSAGWGPEVDPAAVEEAQLALEVAEHELAARTAQLRLLRTRAASTARRREQVEVEVSDLEQQLVELTARLESRREDLERCRREDEQAAASLADMDGTVAAATQERDAARSRLADLTDDE